MLRWVVAVALAAVVLALPVGVVAAPGDDAAAGKSCTDSGHWADWTCSRLFDGVTSGVAQWESSGAPAWVVVDLGSSVYIGSWRVMWTSGRGSEWSIDSSDDGATWVTRYSRSDGSWSPGDLSGSLDTAASARYWRLSIAAFHGAGDADLWSLIEGTPPATATPTASPAPTDSPSPTASPAPTASASPEPGVVCGTDALPCVVTLAPGSLDVLTFAVVAVGSFVVLGVTMTAFAQVRR